MQRLEVSCAVRQRAKKTSVWNRLWRLVTLNKIFLTFITIFNLVREKGEVVPACDMGGRQVDLGSRCE